MVVGWERGLPLAALSYSLTTRYFFTDSFSLPHLTHHSCLTGALVCCPVLSCQPSPAFNFCDFFIHCGSSGSLLDCELLQGRAALLTGVPPAPGPAPHTEGAHSMSVACMTVEDGRQLGLESGYNPALRKRQSQSRCTMVTGLDLWRRLVPVSPIMSVP